MTSIDEQWPNQTPERAVADAFAAFRRRDVAWLAGATTSASLRALAARVGSELDESDSGTPAIWKGEMTDSEAASILGGLIARLPERFTDSVRCEIVGHVLESRLEVRSPDGRRLILFDCRVTGADEEWLSVYGDPEIGRDIANHATGVAHVVFRVAYESAGGGIVPFPPDLQMATTQLVGDEWKLILDEQSDAGLPGFRGIACWYR